MISIYTRLFDNIKENYSSSEFRRNLILILGSFGDTRIVILRYFKKDKFKEEYKKDFIKEISESINTDRTYVGEYEVQSGQSILKKCGINTNLFVLSSKNPASKVIENLNNKYKEDTLYLALKNEHWEYISPDCLCL